MRKSPATLVLYRAAFCLLAAAITDFGLVPVVGQQTVSNFERDRARTMLDLVREDLKKNYYDPTFHGKDLNASFKTADEKIKRATTLGQIMGAIAQFLLEMDDSHTFFVPPERSYRTDYGWRMQVIGDKCYVVAVKPGTDAEAKGLKEGDEIYSIDGYNPLRENIWKLNYFYHALSPQAGMRLVVIKPDGREQQLDVMAKVKQRKRVLDISRPGGDVMDLIREQENDDRLNRHRYFESGEDLFIWKMPAFDLDAQKVDEMAGKFRKRKALILDLRGNGGGYESTMLRLISNLFDRDIKLGDLKQRKEAKPITAKTRGGSNVFAGKIIVLIDSNSGSAAELLARVVQVEKRGTVIGDRSAGAVMRSRHYEHKVGMDVVVFFGASITDADIVMTDGRSLERVGVLPDEIKLPASTDLAAKRDPVLAYAASLVEVKLDAATAGSLFPFEWKK